MARLAFVMAGGAGERFWPLSRASRPKQLLRLADPKRSLLQEAVERIEPLVGKHAVYVITGSALEAPIRESGAVAAEKVWAEPSKRNTLGALVWVAAKLLADGRASDVLAILTADHRIADEDAFRSMVDLALSTAESTGGLVTCGIVPTRPETGYGYIEAGESIGPGVRRAISFREKPEIETARGFVESGNFLWNSGMFFWTVEAFVRELAASNPEAAELLRRITFALESGDDGRAAVAFDELPNMSIDYALMERASEVYVVEGRFGWDDIGAWDALPRSMGADPKGNLVIGEALALGCSDSVLYNESQKQILAALGVEGLIAVATDDAILICPMDHAQRVKELVEELKKDHERLL